MSERLTIIKANKRAYNTLDDEQLFEHTLERLDREGLYQPDRLYCGFDAVQVAKLRSFGERTATYAYSEAHARWLLSGEADDPSTIDYMQGATVPAIGVFNPETLIGSDSKDPSDQLGRVALEDLRNPRNNYLYWETEGGRSLDGVTVAVITFEVMFR